MKSYIYGFVYWLLIIAGLYYLRAYCSSECAYQSRDALFAMGLPWSYLISAPLWQNYLAYILPAIANGFLLLVFVMILKPTSLVNRFFYYTGLMIVFIVVALWGSEAYNETFGVYIVALVWLISMGITEFLKKAAKK